MDSIDYNELLETVLTISKNAGNEILKIYDKND